jgi:tetratricopeptide (TPR) repeat protein
MNITRVLNSLANEQDITDYKKLNIDKLMKLNEHFLELNKHISVDCCSWVKHIEHRDFVELLEKMSKINRKIFFNYENSKMIYLKLLSIYKSHDRFKDDVRLITETLDSIAKMYQYLNNYDEALKYLFESLEIQRKQASNENDLTIAEMLNNIGYVYDYMKNHTEALKYYEDSLKIYTASAKQDYNAISTVLNNIGSVHVAMENNEKALEFYKKATEKSKKIPDNPDNPDNGVLLHNLGFMHYKQGNFVDALKCYTQSLEIKKKKLLPNDPLIGSTLEYLGNVHYDKNEFEKALNFYKESLKIKRQTSTSNHSNIEILHRRISSIEGID